MDDVLLVAASGLAREVLAVIRATGSHRVMGFLDDDSARHGQTVDGAQVIGGLDLAAGFPDVEILLCAGAGRVRRDLRDRLAVGEERFATIVSPTADLANGTVLGRGSIVLGGVVATTAVTIGAHVVLMPNAVLTHDNVLGDYATICAGVVLGGAVTVGEESYVGMAASIRQGLRIGKGATLGMGSVLLQDLPAHQTWAGAPATQLAPVAEPALSRLSPRRGGRQQ